MNFKVPTSLYDECKLIEFRDLRDHITNENYISIHDCNYQVSVSCCYNQKNRFTYRYDYTTDQEILRQANQVPCFDLSPLVHGQIDSVMQNQTILEFDLSQNDKLDDLEITFENGSKVCYHGKHFVSFYHKFLKKYKPLEGANKIEIRTRDKDPYIIKKKDTTVYMHENI